MKAPKPPKQNRTDEAPEAAALTHSVIPWTKKGEGGGYEGTDVWIHFSVEFFFNMHNSHSSSHDSTRICQCQGTVTGNTSLAGCLQSFLALLH